MEPQLPLRSQGQKDNHLSTPESWDLYMSRYMQKQIGGHHISHAQYCSVCLSANVRIVESNNCHNIESKIEMQHKHQIVVPLRSSLIRRKPCLRTVNTSKEADAPSYIYFQKSEKGRTYCSKKCIPGLLFHFCRLASLGNQEQNLSNMDQHKHNSSFPQWHFLLPMYTFELKKLSLPLELPI